MTTSDENQEFVLAWFAPKPHSPPLRASRSLRSHFLSRALNSEAVNSLFTGWTRDNFMSCLHGQMFERLDLIIWHFVSYFLLVLIWWIGLNFEKDMECLSRMQNKSKNLTRVRKKENWIRVKHICADKKKSRIFLLKRVMIIKDSFETGMRKVRSTVSP